MEYPRNFYSVSDTLACSGQPTEEQLKELAAQQYKVVANLGLSNTEYSLTDEAHSVANLNMSYLHIPVEFGSPDISDLSTFIQYMDKNNGQKTLVHCAANYRAVCFTALYLYYKFVKSEEEIKDMINNIWQPNAVWELFLEDGIDHINNLRNS